MEKDVSLAEFLKATAALEDDDTFRWYTVNKDLTIRVTVGELRRVNALAQKGARK